MPDASQPSRPDAPVGATVAQVGERALIERIRCRVPAPARWVAVGIGDDAAVVEPARNWLDVLTTDCLVEGVHFDRAFFPAAAIGHKALAVNLSDLAAMGATPRAALLSLILPDAMLARDVDALLDGLLALAAAFNVDLVGGNIARSPGPLIVDVTALGVVQRRRLLARGGARAGDALFITGTVGEAAAGLGWYQQHQAARRDDAGAAPPSEAGPPPVPDPAGADLFADCRARHLRPEPRVRMGMLLGRSRAASACVDLSDGLADGIHQLARCSGLGAVVEEDTVPIAAGARRWFERQGLDPLDAALCGGDDYELLFAVPARNRRVLAEACRHARGLPVRRIGVMTSDPRVVLRRDGRERDLPRGFAHFR